MSETREETRARLAAMGFEEEAINEALASPAIDFVHTCNFRQETIRERACEGLLWLVDQDRITIDKAYMVALARDGWSQIDLLQEELLSSGKIEGMQNYNDIFILPGGLIRLGEE